MTEILQKPSIEDIRRILAGIPDPEIPVLSLVDLGVIRDLRWCGDELEIRVSPTYSGCPAAAVIHDEIEKALRANGLRQFRIIRQLSPPWTSDWISDRGRDALRRYGIAPPPRSTDKAHLPACPHCGSARTKLVSRFGSTPCKAAYICNDCREPFDHFKCH